MRIKFGIIIFLVVTNLWSQLCLAGEPSNNTKLEIDHLFSYLKSSGCTFNRNGTWYPASDAVDHLQKKYDYLLKKDMITDAESFIAKAATESSMSGKAYEVKCAGKPAIQSSIWFSRELAHYRKEKAQNNGK